ncbi:MAG: nucleotidyltransferase domain-containing protein, partial [Oscillospiraceae bacterium]|nr:nucleotidyltransferase domain-containing protein [Oscillospiraceae bacterium]
SDIVMGVYKQEELTEKIRPIAEKYKVDKVYLFGSYARGEAVEESDIDLVVSTENLEGLKFFGFYEDLRETFEKDVDLVTEEQINKSRNDPLHQRFIEELETDKMVIYSL